MRALVSNVYQFPYMNRLSSFCKLSTPLFAEMAQHLTINDLNSKLENEIGVYRLRNLAVRSFLQQKELS